jgi:hypothetical protein
MLLGNVPTCCHARHTSWSDVHTAAPKQHTHTHTPAHPHDRYFACSLPKLAAYSPHQLASTLAALATLAPERAPPPPWAAAVLHRVECEVPHMSGPCLCDVMWGLLELRIQPGQALTAK